MAHQVVIAVRTATRTPATSLFIVLILTVSIAASVAIFALIDAALLKPLPFPDAERLVTFTYTFNGRVVPRASEAKFVVWREAGRALEDQAAVQMRAAELGGADDRQRIHVGAVTGTFFHLFGMPFTRGRPFTDVEARADGGAVVVLSWGFWQRQFGGDPSALGRQLQLDGRPVTVVGIAATFDASLLGGQPDMWVPLQLDLTNPQHPPFLTAYARLRPAVSLRQAQEDDEQVAREFRRRHPDVLAAADTFAVRRFSDIALTDLRQPLGLLAGAVALLLVLGCMNVAGLLLVVMTGRRREIAVRTAVGASTHQIAVQLLTESAILTLAAAGLGAVLGLSAARLVVALAPTIVPRLPDGPASLTLDGRLAVFVGLLVLITTVASTVLPMWASTSTGLAEVLRGNSAAIGTSRRVHLVRSVTVGAQVALATLLTVGATLLAWTPWQLHTADRGFSIDHVTTMRTSLATPTEQLSSDRVAGVVEAVLDRLTAVPGVESAASTCCLPLESDWLTSFQVVGRGSAEAAGALLSERRISSTYFDVLAIPIVRGRGFTTQDRSTTPQVAVINQTMARELWPGEDPLGAQVRLFPGTAPDADTRVRTIVGVVADVRDGLAMAERPRPTVYLPLAQVPDRQQDGELAWLIKSRGPSFDPSAAQRAVRAGTQGRAVFDMGSLDRLRVTTSADTALRATLLVLFSTAALLLATAGVYTAISTTVRQRWHDMSVRLALGARPNDLRLQIVRDALRVVLVGTATGLVGAVAGSRVIAAFLSGVSATDPWVFLLVATLLASVAAPAAWLPASRVLRLNVAELLRRE